MWFDFMFISYHLQPWKMSVSEAQLTQQNKQKNKKPTRQPCGFCASGPYYITHSILVYIATSQTSHLVKIANWVIILLSFTSSKKKKKKKLDKL